MLPDCCAQGLYSVFLVPLDVANISKPSSPQQQQQQEQQRHRELDRRHAGLAVWLPEMQKTLLNLGLRALHVGHVFTVFITSRSHVC